MMIECVCIFCEIFVSILVDEVEVKEYLVVLFCVNVNIWIDVKVCYVVDFKCVGSVKIWLM